MSEYGECESRGSCDEARDRLTEVEAEIERLRAALKQVIVDCEDAGNLSYAARTARDARAYEQSVGEQEDRK